MDSGSWYRKSQNPQRSKNRAHAPRPTVLILRGSHGHSSCLGGQKGYLKPRLAVQSSQSRPQPHYNLPHKAIYVVWQHGSHKQREHTDSRIAKGSGLIFFRTSDFFEFDCNFSNTLMPVPPQSTRGFPAVPSTASNFTLPMAGGFSWRRGWHWQNTACSRASQQKKLFFSAGIIQLVVQPK